MIRTVADLIRELEDACAGADPADVPVNIVSIGAYTATKHQVGNIVSDDDERGTVLIGEGDQVGYLNRDARTNF
jgi:hypothetical protein